MIVSITNSRIDHRFTRAVSYNKCFRRMATLPSNTRLRYLGIQTKWYCNRCLVWALAQYLPTTRACQTRLQSDNLRCRTSGRPFIPRLKSLGFSGRPYKVWELFFLVARWFPLFGIESATKGWIVFGFNSWDHLKVVVSCPAPHTPSP